MNKVGYLFVAVAMISGLVGCGSDDSRPALPFLDAQKTLPDEGYWFCRLDYTVHFRNGDVSEEFFAMTGQGRGAVKQKIAQQCINSAYEVDCSEAVTNHRYLCARAENTGHLGAYPEVTYCNLPFKVTYRNGKIEERTYESTGKNQEEAVKKIFNGCIRGFYPRECTDAILADAMNCRPVQ